MWLKGWPCVEAAGATLADIGEGYQGCPLYPPKADILIVGVDVCYVPKADIFHPGFGH